MNVSWLRRFVGNKLLHTSTQMLSPQLLFSLSSVSQRGEATTILQNKTLDDTLEIFDPL